MSSTRSTETSSVYNVHDAKTHLSELLAKAERGEEVVIARAGVPVVRLQPVSTTVTPRRPGTARGLFVVPPEFDDPLPDELLSAFR